MWPSLGLPAKTEKLGHPVVTLLPRRFFLGFLAVGGADYCLHLTIFPMDALGKLIGQVSDIGFTLTTAILGFLIAGISIFSTITWPEIFAALAKLDHKGSGISRL